MSLKENELQETIVYSKSPRHGHGQDVVDDNGIRQVAGCLPIDPVSKRFLLVTSSSHQDVWVIPKGGWETDETQIQAAMRETWEEAGVKGVIQKHIGVFEEKTKHGVKAHHWIYELEIKEITKRFPEQKKRERRWFTFDEAMLAVKANYIKEAIRMSSISPVSNEKKKKKKSKKKESDDEDSESSKDKKKKKNKKKDSEDEDSESSKEKKKKDKKKKDSEDDDSESSKEKKEKKKNKKKDSEDDDSESSKEKKEKKDKKKKKKDSEDEDSESSKEKKEKKDKKKKKEKKNKESEDDDSENSKEKKSKKKDDSEE